MRLFDAYPDGGRSLLGRPKSGDATCRRGYGLDLARRTGQTRCAYCGVSLVDSYDHWLLISVDHVVPQAVARRLGIPDDFLQDCTNLALACSACNGFGNRVKVSDELATPKPSSEWTLDEFFALRDALFDLRSRQVAVRRADEQAFYSGSLWL